MKSQANLNLLPEASIKVPQLVEYNKQRCHFIVLMTTNSGNRGDGVVVHNFPEELENETQWEVGNQGTNWVLDSFIPYKGEIILRND